VDAELQRVCRERIIAAAENEIRTGAPLAYRMAFVGTGWRPIRYGWGCGTGFFAGGEFLVLAWRLTGQKRYRDYALLAADFSLGCHPTGMVFITGVGQRHIKWALHAYSNPLAARIGAPTRHAPPGYPINGIHAYPLKFSGWAKQLLYVYANPAAGKDNFYPPSRQWPDLRLFADIGWAPILAETNSVAGNMLRTVFLYGSLLPRPAD